MKLTLLLVRHSSTDWTKFGFLSETDINLNESGLKKAEELALKMRDLKIDAIFSSPMKRTMNTARKIANLKNLKVVPCNDLKEVNFGIFEGMSREEARKSYPSLFEEREKNKWIFTIPNGENYESAYERVTNFVEKIKKEFENKSVMLVSHATLINLLLVYFGKYTVEDIKNNRIEKVNEAACFKIYVDDFKVKIDLLQ